MFDIWMYSVYESSVLESSLYFLTTKISSNTTSAFSWTYFCLQQKQPTKVLSDLTDRNGGGHRRKTDNFDTDSAEPVPLAYISYEDKSAKKNGAVKK